MPGARARSNRYATALALAAALLALPWPGVAGEAADGLRGLALERDLLAARGRLGRTSGSLDADLDRARREVHWLRIGAPLDPQLERLEGRIRDLEWDAERIDRRQAMRASLREIRSTRERLPVPRDLRPPYATDLRGEELPIGAGKQIILIQNSLRQSEHDLAAGRVAGAARHLARAEAGLRAFTSAYAAITPPDDPQLVAAHAGIARLRVALAAD